MSDESGKNFQATLADGMAMGVWLEREVRPALKRWARSGDKRVRMLSGMFRDLIESRVESGDTAFLSELFDSWEKHNVPGDTAEDTPDA